MSATCKEWGTSDCTQEHLGPQLLCQSIINRIFSISALNLKRDHYD